MPFCISFGGELNKPDQRKGHGSTKNNFASVLNKMAWEITTGRGKAATTSFCVDLERKLNKKWPHEGGNGARRPFCTTFE
jgi:hypothetical protein